MGMVWLNVYDNAVVGKSKFYRNGQYLFYDFDLNLLVYWTLDFNQVRQSAVLIIQLYLF